MLSNFISIFLFIALSTSAYNSPDSPSWPSAQVWADELGSTLSEDAALHGPFADDNYYRANCEVLGMDAYAISRSGNGICMHSHACQYEFCRDTYAKDLPGYTLEAKTPSDIQAALEFSRTHNIQVTIKTSGHSYHGASTARNSLLIWMQNYPKNDTITDNYESCDGAIHHAIISINGGETWNDVIEAVGDKYHVVAGGGRTVSAAGGWLMGSGLSFHSRKYGLGVDNVLEFQVVKADGSLITANACENTDLFWALRGGGGGTWGVVTNVKYKLHPVTPVTETYWFIQNYENAPNDESISFTVSTWLKFLIEFSKDLDPRFGGFWNGSGIYLVFAGTREEANAAFLGKFELWYWTKLKPNANFNPSWGWVSPSAATKTWSSYYDLRGGSDSYNNPLETDATGAAYEGIYISARLMPLSKLEDDPEGVFNLLYDLSMNKEIGYVNYLLGGVISDVSEDATSVSPALRNAVWNVFTNTDTGTTKVHKYLPNNITGACFNHHSPVEPDWRNGLWGGQYDRLLELKGIFDPTNVFRCWHCVGYEGEENPPLTSRIPGFCFSGESTVKVQNKGSVKMTDLTLGDIVQVASGKYEPIYSFGHKDSQGQVEFLQIRTSINNLEISLDHMVITKGGSYIPASMVKKGDLLLTATEDLAEVTSITTVVRQGAFAPFTTSGTIVVNGILASNYIAYQRSEYLKMGGLETPFTFQWIAHTFNSIHRLARMAGITGESYGEGGISSWVDLPHKIMLWALKQNAIISTTLIGLALILVSATRLIEIMVFSPVYLVIGGTIGTTIYWQKQSKK